MVLTSRGIKQKGVIGQNSKMPKNVKLSEMNYNSSKTGLKRRKQFYNKARGVVCLSHIPHGFYEDQMRAYFKQFGKVRQTSVVRSKKTGHSKGYGFVEFDDEEVAKIAAETMNNYLMYSKLIKCRYIPPEERKGRIFGKPYITNDFPRKKNRVIDAQNKRKAFSNLNQANYLKKTNKKINEFKKFFEERGIDFKFKISEKPQDNEVEECKRKTTSKVLETESKDEENDQFGVLEIDESDHDISFKTPPKVKKVIKKSHNISAHTSKKVKNENSPLRKKVGQKKLSNLKNSKVQKTKKQKIKKEKNQKIKKVKNQNQSKIKRKGNVGKKARPSKNDSQSQQNERKHTFSEILISC